MTGRAGVVAAMAERYEYAVRDDAAGVEYPMPWHWCELVNARSLGCTVVRRVERVDGIKVSHGDWHPVREGKAGSQFEPSSCILLRCAGCGELLDEDYVVHFADEAEARALATSTYEWRERDGKLYCTATDCAVKAVADVA